MTKRFTAETMVAEAISADPSVVDRLVALHPTFGKLKNPVLRKVMSRLVNFGDAARVAGIPLEALLAAANGEPPPSIEPPTAPGGTPRETEPEPRPDWVDRVDPETAARYDARPVLAAGEEPLGPVLRLAAKVRRGGDLVLEAPFDPAPLRRVLARKGFASYGERIADDHWRITFRRDRKLATAQKKAAEAAAGEVAKVWRDEAIVHIDVRGLEAPLPMVSILELIERPDTGDAVIVHHEREPHFLYPELAERGWSHEIVEGAAGEVRLRLARGHP